MKVPIEYEFWGKKFPHVGPELYAKLGLELYLCPKTTDYYISGNFNSDKYSLVEIEINKCKESGCQSTADIEQVLKTHYLDIQLINSYFDFNDFSSPIKPFLQDMNYVSLVPNLSFNVMYKIKRNEVLRDENYFVNTLPSTTYFYSIGDRQTFTNNFRVSQNYVLVYFVLSQEYEEYERTRFTFLDVWGLIGGIFEICRIVGFYTVSFTSSHQFYNSLLSRLYHVEAAEDKSNKVNPKADKTFSKLHIPTQESRMDMSEAFKEEVKGNPAVSVDKEVEDSRFYNNSEHTELQ